MSTVRIYLYCICFYCFSYNYSLTRFCLFVCFAPQQSSVINNNVNTSAIKSIANTPFPPKATGTPQQQQQLQPERVLTMAIATCRLQHADNNTAIAKWDRGLAMIIVKYKVRISNNNTMPNAHNNNNNNTMLDARNSNKIYNWNAIR